MHVPGSFVVASLVFTAVALLALAVPSCAIAATAHTDSSTSADADCAVCHTPHTAPGARDLLSGAAESTICYSCHGDTGGSNWNVETGSDNSFDASTQSGHTLEEVVDPESDVDLTDSCSGCHGPHGDPGLRVNLPSNEQIVGATVDPGNPRSWCLACHNSEQAWWTSVPDVPARTAAEYGDLVQDPARDADHYPDEGTFPGADVYATSTSLHANISAWEIESAVNPGEPVTRVAGDCLWCHASHRSDAAYDGLLAEFGPSVPTDTTSGSYAQLCFECHGNSSEGSASEIFTSTSATPLDDAYWAAADAGGDAAGAADIFSLVTAGAERSGHRIESASGAFYAQGSPLPCYECHNPHGSKNGNTVMISDALGGNLDPRGTEAEVRRFCFSCHTTADTGAAWDSDANNDGVHTDGVYTTVLANTAAGSTVVGLSRSAAEPLRLPDVSGHRVGDTTKSCLSCHGTAHNPTGGVSPGGIECSLCHSALSSMVNSTTSYHHVLDDSNWDQAPNAGGTYPTSTQTLSCVSCHVDHSDYEGLPGTDPTKADGKAFSLRSSALDSTPVATDTDGPLCLSCHTAELSRNTTGQKANTIPETHVWKIDATQWSTSPHNYTASGPFDDGSVFNANCAKCHGTLEGTLSSGKFSVHYSPEQRLLNALGDTSAATLAVNEEQMCFRCHSKAADFAVNGGTLAGTPKPSDYVDWYGGEAMSESNVSIYAQMTSGANTYGHKPHLYDNDHLLSDADESQTYISATKHVECADCHNHHVVGVARHTWGTSNVVSAAIQGVTGQGFKLGTGEGMQALENVNWPTDAAINAQLEWQGPANSTPYSVYEYQICYKCHSSENTNLATWGGTKSGTVAANRWTNVAADFSVGNQSRHPVVATLDGYVDLDLDGSTTDEAMIPGYSDTATYGTNKVYTGQLNTTIFQPGATMYCSDCHGNANSPLPTAANALDFTQGPHGSSVAFSLRGPNTLWPANASGTLWTLSMAGLADDNGSTSGDDPFCSNCHPNLQGSNVHKRAAAHQTATCVTCHTLIPHGGGMSRLIADCDGDGDANLYEAGEMPARFAYNNNKATSYIASYTKSKTPLTYEKGNCSIANTTTAKSACTGGGGRHSATLVGTQTGLNTSTTDTTDYWENW